MKALDRKSQLSPAPSVKMASGPREIPFLGSSIALLRDNLGFVKTMARKYGDVVRYHMGPMLIYQVNHPDGVQRILQDNNHNYSKDTFNFPFMRVLLGNGLVMSQGDVWLQQRRLMQPKFHRRTIEHFGAIMTQKTLAMLARWKHQEAGGEPLDVHSEMVRLTLAIVAQTLFGARVDEEKDDLGEAISFLVEDVSYRFQVPFYPPLSVPTPRNRRFLRAVATLDRTIQRIVDERRAQSRSRPEDDREEDLLSLLLYAQDEETGEGMSDKQLRDELMTLLIAGHETTSNLLSWVFYILSKHSDVRDRLHAELDQVLGGRVPEASDLRRLVYTRMVLEETLRLYPPAWISNRSSREADVICGYHIPAKTFIAFSPYVIHRHPQFWPEPQKFDPERFAPGADSQRPRYAYLPFGGGPHLCIGRDFAMMEATLVVATLLQHVDLRLLPGTQVRPQALATLRPRDGLPMLLTPRPAR